MGIIDQIKLALSVAGDLWFIALVGSFFVMVCESAKPKAQEGEADAGEPKGFALWISIMSLLTPLLLLIHAVFGAGAPPFGAIAAVFAAVIAAALIGWLIAGVAAPIGRVLNRAAIVLAVPVFALTIYVTWETIFGLVNALVTRSAA